MIIPILHKEKQVQLQDLTRFDASKSVLVKGSANPIIGVKIKAGEDSTEVDVYNTDPKKWFLDWAFSQYAFDVGPENSELVFEVSGTRYETNVLTGTYDLANLLTAIKNAMEAIAPPLSVSLTVDEKNRITIVPSLPLKILPNYSSAGLLRHLGFKEDGQLVGFPVEYGLRKVTVTIEAGTLSPYTVLDSASVSEFVEVYTEEGDSLFSEDSDLVSEEPDIMKWLPNGRGSYKDLHRKAQKLILDWCDRQGYRDDLQRKITKWAFVDHSDVRMWSYYMVLRLFFMGAQNDVDDVFKKKASYYEKLEIASRDRAVLNLDLDGDDKSDIPNGPDIRSGRLFFR
jgi:hypothetical protein